MRIRCGLYRIYGRNRMGNFGPHGSGNNGSKIPALSDVRSKYWTLNTTQPALSFLVNLTALIILYRTRRNNIVHAGWILTLDLLTTLLLVMHTLFAEYTFNDDVTGQNSGVKEAFVDLQAVWILGLILCVFQFVSFIIDIRDTHVRRRVDREYAEAITMKQDPNFADPERQAGLEDVELKDRLVVGVRDNQIAEASGSVRVEVPDSGRAELHASHKVEMPDTGKAELHSSHKVELPAIRTLELPMDYAGMGSSRQVSPIELPTPDSVANGWQKDKTSVRSFA